MKPSAAYEWLKRESVGTGYLSALGELAAWDQRTYLPPKGHDHRAEQLATLALIIHERRTNPKIGECLADVDGLPELSEPTSAVAVNVREWRRAYQRSIKIPGRLAEELARATAEGETAWEAARVEDDWNAFAPHLERILSLTREKAEAVGYESEPYDALIEEYEPGETTAALTTLFNGLKAPIVTLTEAIAESPVTPNAAILSRPFSVASQQQLSKQVAALLGYDFESGRLDESVHPFTIGISPGDVRITTRFNEHYLPSALLGTIHEAGHGIYEQGLPAVHFGTPRGQVISLGVHESQSRLYENFVGRSRAFWTYLLPIAKTLFSALDEVSLDDFLLALNDVRPSLIRVEADEVTYNLHIILRFELEVALMRGELSVADLPGAWNEKMAHILRLTPKTHRDGVLQDVHWAAGLVGYFPTYTLGNIYAAQLFEAAVRSIGDMALEFEQGRFLGLCGWLRDNIHAFGSTYLPRELVAHATGERPNPRYLIGYFNRKFGALYDLDTGSA
jgi:carboxypeptidase Taq